MRVGVNRSTTFWRIFAMALVFLVMSCESDADGDGCLGSTDDLITGMSDGCGTGMKPIGDGCLGRCILGGDRGWAAVVAVTVAPKDTNTDGARPHGLHPRTAPNTHTPARGSRAR